MYYPADTNINSLWLCRCELIFTDLPSNNVFISLNSQLVRKNYFFKWHTSDAVSFISADLKRYMLGQISKNSTYMRELSKTSKIFNKIKIIIFDLSAT